MKSHSWLEIPSVNQFTEHLTVYLEIPLSFEGCIFTLCNLSSISVFSVLGRCGNHPQTLKPFLSTSNLSLRTL